MSVHSLNSVVSSVVIASVLNTFISEVFASLINDNDHTRFNFTIKKLLDR